MTVTQTLGALGAWNVQLKDETPDDVLDQLGWFGHIVIVAGPVDPVAYGGDPLLRAARYVGVLRARTADRRGLAGEGMRFWIADEDGKGKVLETEVSFTNATLDQCVTALLPPAAPKGTVFAQPDPAQRYTGKHKLQTRLQALEIVLAAFGVEYRIRGDGFVDVGTQANLYSVTPDSIISRWPLTGTDMEMVAVSGEIETNEQVRDFTTRVLLVGQTTEGGTFATGAMGGPDATYLDIRGNPVELTRIISESQETTGSVQSRAQLHYNRFHRVVRSVTLTADRWASEGSFVVGDNAYVYDPDSAIVNPANGVDFRGERIWPDLIRVVGHTWPVTAGHTVGFRTVTGGWVDLTDYVVFETGGGEVVVGDLPASLLRKGDDPLAVRVDASQGVPNAVAPKAPTALNLSSAAGADAKGKLWAYITASWTPPTQNTDNTALTDLSHYVVAYRWQGRVEWQEMTTGGPSADIEALVLGLVYDVKVCAVDSQGMRSAFTAISPITAAVDTTPPSSPSQPTLEPYFGLLRIKWDGLSVVGGAMNSDFQRVDVHVSATSGFTPTAATLKSSSSTAGIVGHIDAPYGATRFVKLVAVDTAQNQSTPSAQASGATVQVNDGDIQALNVGKLTSGIVTADITVSGRFATALTGARREMNALGFQAWDASNNLIINLDGVNNLLTGLFQTARTGRRISLGAAGKIGEITFTAPDGTEAFVKAWTENTGLEAIQLGVLIPSTGPLWNRVNFNTDEWSTFRSGTVEFVYRAAELFHIVSNPNPQDVPYPAGDLERFRIDSTKAVLRAPSTLAYLYVDNDEVQLRPGDIDLTGMIQVENHGITDSFFRSPNLRFYTDNNNVNGAGYFVGLLKYFVNASSTGPRFQARNGDDTAFAEVEAAAFTVTSALAGKTDVTDLDVDALAMVRATTVHRYRPVRGPVVRYLDDDGRPAGFEEVGAAPAQIGLIAEEAPAEILGTDGDRVDLYQAVSLLWKAVQELDGRGRP